MKVMTFRMISVEVVGEKMPPRQQAALAADVFAKEVDSSVSVQK